MKTTKTFNIYCDESTHLIHDGHPYMLLGYVSIAFNQMDMAKAQIKEIKDKHGYHGELKWTSHGERLWNSLLHKPLKQLQNEVRKNAETNSRKPEN